MGGLTTSRAAPSSCVSTRTLLGPSLARTRRTVRRTLRPAAAADSWDSLIGGDSEAGSAEGEAHGGSSGGPRRGGLVGRLGAVIPKLAGALVLGTAGLGVLGAAPVGASPEAAGAAAGPASVTSSARYSAATAPFASMKVSATAGMLLKYKTQQILNMGIATKIAFVCAMAVPMVMIGAVFYRSVTGFSWGESMFKVYSVLNDAPGAAVTEEEGFWPTVVLNIVFVFGLFTFAIILGIVCDDISGTVDDLRNGNSAIPETNHTVILGWNDQTTKLLQQIDAANKDNTVNVFPSPVVILADREKEEMDSDLSDVDVDIQVYCREGKPYVMVDLEKVNAGAAKTVIVLEDPEDEMDDAKAATTLVGLTASGGGPANDQVIVVQQSEPDSESAAAIASELLSEKKGKRGQGRIITLDQHKNINTLMAQCAIQPGLGRVSNHIFTVDSSENVNSAKEFYIKGLPGLKGKTFGEVRKSMPRATAIGYTRPSEGSHVLNPSDDAVLEAGDSIITIASKCADVKLGPTVKARSLSDRSPKEVRAAHAKKPLRIVVASFGDALDDELVEALSSLAPRGTTVTVLQDGSPGSLPRGTGVRFRHVNADPASLAGLKAARVTNADSIILAGISEEESGAHDAQVLASLMNLQRLATEADRAGNPLHIVSTTMRNRTHIMVMQLQEMGALPMGPRTSVRRDVGKSTSGNAISYDLLQPSNLQSGILTQVAANPELQPIIEELLEDDNAELYLRSAANYGLTDKGKMSWIDVQETVRASGELAIGYSCAQTGSMDLAPGAKQVVTLGPGDDIIVLDED